MELLRFFLKEAPEKTLHILILSVISGMSEVASVLLTINGAQDVAAGRNYMLYAILLPAAALVFVLSKRISQTQAAALTESILEGQGRWHLKVVWRVCWLGCKNRPRSKCDPPPA